MNCPETSSNDHTNHLETCINQKPTGRLNPNVNSTCKPVFSQPNYSSRQTDKPMMHCHITRGIADARGDKTRDEDPIVYLL